MFAPPGKSKMTTKDKKVVKATAKKPGPKVKDSTEIDDLFSTLTKKTKTEVTEVVTDKKETVKVKKETEVTLSELEDLEDEDCDDEIDSDSDSEKVLVKGTAYDPKKDDSFPATTVSSLPDSDFFDSRGLKRKTRALTEDGYPIYTPKELKIGMGGGTDLCPFDCNCCF